MKTILILPFNSNYMYCLPSISLNFRPVTSLTYSTQASALALGCLSRQLHLRSWQTHVRRSTPQRSTPQSMQHRPPPLTTSTTSSVIVFLSSSCAKSHAPLNCAIQIRDRLSVYKNHSSNHKNHATQSTIIKRRRRTCQSCG